MTARIERLSRAGHDLISDVHPQVSEIKEHVENVREAVSSEKSSRVDLLHRMSAIRSRPPNHGSSLPL